MVFSSYLFLFYFLPLVIGIYCLAPKLLKNLALVLASIVFYSWSEPKFLLLLFLLCAIDYLLAFKIEQQKNIKYSWGLIISLVINILALGYFKYTNFFLTETNRIFSFFDYAPLEWKKVILPIGISFFTFHKISYVVDVYRGIRPAVKNPINFLLYILFFPQLISGPIIRYHEIEDQIHSRTTSINQIYEGFIRFAFGLAKKVLIADVVGHTADRVFALSPSALSPQIAWIGIIAYTAQIYFDFSGYSDMAIGLAKVFGFNFPENFNNPYIAKSFTDFWRRWHMSFGRWMREYLYYPLGGNRCSELRNYFNLWVIFIFSGLWHGAEWTFVLWGIWHGLFMTLEKLFLQKYLDRCVLVVQVFFTLLMVMLSRVLFRADSLKQALIYYKSLVVVPDNNKFVALGTLTSNHEVIMIILAYLLCLYPLVPSLNRCQNKFIQSFYLKGVTAVILFILSILALTASDFSPFIYFQF